MNLYLRNLDDYVRTTGHLSALEHGVLMLLTDRYYVTEAGIPADQIYRLARVQAENERAAVDAVLREFFVLIDGVWRNHDIEQKIVDARKREFARVLFGTA